MIPYIKCMHCEHFDFMSDINLPTCTAFPKGIPWGIWREEIDHEKPFPGDHGIQFGKIKD